MPLPPPVVITAVAASPPPPPPEGSPLLPSCLAPASSENVGSGEGMIRSNKRRSSVAFAPVRAFTPEEGTPPENVVRLRESALLGSGLLAPLSANRRASVASTGSNVSWAPEVRSPPKSREKLHKQARRLSDASLDEAENEA